MLDVCWVIITYSFLLIMSIGGSFKNSESFERATRDVHGEKLQVFILERLVVFSPKADF
jgi:hypothetical protein